MVGEHLIPAEHLIGGYWIKPGGDSEAVVVVEGGAGGGQQLFRRRLGKEVFNFRSSRIHQEAIGFTVRVCTVVGAVVATETLEKLSGDAGALKQRVVRPCGVAVHAAEQNAMILVCPCAEVLIKNICVRPKGERQALDLYNVSAHAASGALGFVDKGRELVECGDFVGCIGADQA